MSHPLRVHLFTRDVPGPDADEAIHSATDDLVQARGTGDLTEIRRAEQALAAAERGVQVWHARIGDAEIPLVGFSLDQDADGTPLISFAMAPDSIQIGDPPVAAHLPTVDESTQPKLRVWGEPTRDPRESIPGWAPESLGKQVATNAEALA